MNEQHPAARAAGIIGTRPPAREPFDPAGLLEGRKPPPLPYATGPSVVVAKEFDPADFLGARALRGAFNLATVKPLVTTIGGVEMVTVPASAYSDALRRIAAQELPPETVEQAGPVLNAEGMFGLLMIEAEKGWPRPNLDDIRRATGLDEAAFGERVAAWKAAQPKPWIVDTIDADGTMRGKTPEGVPFYVERALDPPASPIDFVPSPEEARVDLVDGDKSEADAPEAHGAALDTGRPTEAHGAAVEAVKPGRHPRATKANREVP